MFLTQQVEALTLHNRYCEGQLTRPNLPHAALMKLHEQKNLLEQQMRLMNEQILKYRVCVMCVHACVRACVDVWCVCVCDLCNSHPPRNMLNYLLLLLG